MLIGKKAVSAALACMLAATPVPGAANDLGKALAIGAVGVMAGCALTGKCQKKSPSRSSGVSSAQRAQNKSVQSALNAFGFPVGTPDGALGPKSRAGISNYQSYMGYNPTGYLNDYERSILLESHQRMNAGGGQAYPQVVAQEGPKGLLKAFNDPNYPPRATSVPIPQPPVVAAAPVAPQLPAATLPQVTQATPALPTLAPLPGLQKASTSMSERCEVVDLMTRTNQGPMQVANLTDADQALSEQFCAARSFAILDGQSTAESYNLSAEQVDQACGLVKDAMAAPMSKLSTADPASIVVEAKAAGASLSGGDATRAGVYGRVCTGVGYRSNDAEIALGGLLMMVGSGAAPYGEMLGHHVREGFGATSNDGTAAAWYTDAMDALEQGQEPAFLPTTSHERMRVIRQAVALDAQQASLPALNASQPQAPQPVLPVLVAVQ